MMESKDRNNQKQTQEQAGVSMRATLEGRFAGSTGHTDLLNTYTALNCKFFEGAENKNEEVPAISLGSFLSPLEKGQYDIRPMDEGSLSDGFFATCGQMRPDSKSLEGLMVHCGELSITDAAEKEDAQGNLIERSFQGTATLTYKNRQDNDPDNQINVNIDVLKVSETHAPGISVASSKHEKPANTPDALNASFAQNKNNSSVTMTGTIGGKLEATGPSFINIHPPFNAFTCHFPIELQGNKVLTLYFFSTRPLAIGEYAVSADGSNGYAVILSASSPGGMGEKGINATRGKVIITSLEEGKSFKGHGELEFAHDNAATVKLVISDIEGLQAA